MTAQDRILRACVAAGHAAGQRPTVDLHGEMIAVCAPCWNTSVFARRAERKAQLAARPKDCARCGARPHTWTYGGFKLCGRCKTATAQEHGRALAKAGALAIFATAPLVDTSSWAARRQTVAS